MKQEGASLPEVERQFPRLVELAPDAVFLHGLDGRFRYVNAAACAVLGYSRDELLSMCPWDFVVNDSRDDILAFWRGMAPGVPVMVEGLFRRKDGTTLPAEVRLSWFEDAGRDWIAAFCRDITARRKAEDALRSEERSRMVRDIHDTLAHGLTAIAVQLEAARHVIGTKPDEVAAHVGNALQLAREGLREARRAFDDLVRQGKILYAGVSDMPAWVVAKANTLADLRGWSPFVGLQIEYSLIERTPERELLPMAASLGLGVTAWSPLAGGVLTGKQLDSGGAKDSRQSDPGMKQFMASDARKEAIAREVVAVARECGHSPAQVALAWLRQRSTLVIPIIGARKLAQVKDNLASVDIRLEPSLVQRLDSVSLIEMGFPGDFFAKEMVRNLASGGMRGRIDA